jgi:hypothetical protein
MVPPRHSVLVELNQVGKTRPSHRILDERSRLEASYPFARLNPGRRFYRQRLSMNEFHRLVDRTPVDSVHGTADPVHTFFPLENNSENNRNSLGTVFYRKTLLVYFIYILVPTILQKQP